MVCTTRNSDNNNKRKIAVVPVVAKRPLSPLTKQKIKEQKEKENDIIRQAALEIIKVRKESHNAGKQKGQYGVIQKIYKQYQQSYTFCTKSKIDKMAKKIELLQQQEEEEHLSNDNDNKESAVASAAAAIPPPLLTNTATNTTASPLLNVDHSTAEEEKESNDDDDNNNNNNNLSKQEEQNTIKKQQQQRTSSNNGESSKSSSSSNNYNNILPKQKQQQQNSIIKKHQHCSSGEQSSNHRNNASSISNDKTIRARDNNNYNNNIKQKEINNNTSITSIVAGAAGAAAGGKRKRPSLPVTTDNNSNKKVATPIKKKKMSSDDNIHTKAKTKVCKAIAKVAKKSAKVAAPAEVVIEKTEKIKKRPLSPISRRMMKEKKDKEKDIIRQAAIEVINERNKAKIHNGMQKGTYGIVSKIINRYNTFYPFCTKSNINKMAKKIEQEQKEKFCSTSITTTPKRTTTPKKTTPQKTQPRLVSRTATTTNNNIMSPKITLPSITHNNNNHRNDYKSSSENDDDDDSSTSTEEESSNHLTNNNIKDTATTIVALRCKNDDIRQPKDDKTTKSDEEKLKELKIQEANTEAAIRYMNVKNDYEKNGIRILPYGTLTNICREVDEYMNLPKNTIQPETIRKRVLANNVTGNPKGNNTATKNTNNNNNNTVSTNEDNNEITVTNNTTCATTKAAVSTNNNNNNKSKPRKKGGRPKGTTNSSKKDNRSSSKAASTNKNNNDNEQKQQQPRKKGGRPKGTTKLNIERLKELEIQANTEAATRYMNVKTECEKKGERIPHGTLVNICREVEESYIDLPKNTIKPETIRKRALKNNLSGINEGRTSPLLQIEPQIIDLCRKVVILMNQPINKHIVIQLAIDIISNNPEYAKRFIEWKRKHVYVDPGTTTSTDNNDNISLSVGWYNLFRKRNKKQMKSIQDNSIAYQYTIKQKTIWLLNETKESYKRYMILNNNNNSSTQQGQQTNKNLTSYDLRILLHYTTITSNNDPHVSDYKTLNDLINAWNIRKQRTETIHKLNELLILDNNNTTTNNNNNNNNNALEDDDNDDGIVMDSSLIEEPVDIDNIAV